MTRTLFTLGLLVLAAHPAQASPAVDATKAGFYLALKVDGRGLPCNTDFRLVDDGKGEASFVTGHGRGARTVMALFTRQTPDLENAYGYALRPTAVTLMPTGPTTGASTRPPACASWSSRTRFGPGRGRCGRTSS